MKRRLCLAGVLLLGLLLSSACTSDSHVESGRRLLASYGCGSCHSIPGVPGAYALAAPPLDRFNERSYIAGRLSNTRDNLAKWIQNPQQIEPGTAMPNLSVPENEAQDMVAYLYAQSNPTLIGELNR